MRLPDPMIFPPRSPALGASPLATKIASLPAAWITNCPRGALGRTGTAVTFTGELGLPSTPSKLFVYPSGVVVFPKPSRLSVIWLIRLTPHVADFRKAAFAFQ